MELQHSQSTRTLAQLNTLIHEPEMVCTIVAISAPDHSPTLSTARFNALIVHDHEWYLLRNVSVKLLHQLLPLIEDVHRVFFIDQIIQDLSAIHLETAADYLVSLQPCLLCASNLERLFTLAMPYQGFAASDAARR